MFETLSVSLAPPKRGEGWGEGIRLIFKGVQCRFSKTDRICVDPHFQSHPTPYPRLTHPLNMAKIGFLLKQPKRKI